MTLGSGASLLTSRYGSNFFTNPQVIIQNQAHLPQRKSSERWQVVLISVARHARRAVAPQLSMTTISYPSSRVPFDEPTNRRTTTCLSPSVLFQLANGCPTLRCSERPQAPTDVDPCFRQKILIFPRLEAAAHRKRGGSSYLCFLFFYSSRFCRFLSLSRPLAAPLPDCRQRSLGDRRERDLPFPSVLSSTPVSLAGRSSCARRSFCSPLSAAVITARGLFVRMLTFELGNTSNSHASFVSSFIHQAAGMIPDPAVEASPACFCTQMR